MSFGPKERLQAIDRLASDRFDLVVVGGGITGAGIFRDAVLRGLKVALVERDDFAFGTSSRSSKLVHGGLRYLEQYNFGLVYESTQERARLMTLARHVVRPLGFVFPVWEGSKHGLWFMHMGLCLYDILGSFKNYRLHRKLDSAQTLVEEPMLRKDGLKGALHYYDAITDDARLTIETIIDGHRQGGLALSRCEAREATFADGRIRALRVFDRISQTEIDVQTQAVVAAAGPWTESVLGVLGVDGGPRLRPTKGTHIVLPFSLLPLKQAVAVPHPADGRTVFAIPWHGATVVGTTDTDYEGPFDQVFASAQDVEYLLHVVRHTFPGFKGTATDLLGTWAGLRPLLLAADEGLTESQISREHIVTTDARGVVAIAGGKLTTYRLMAIEAVEAAIRVMGRRRVPKSTTAKRPLPYCAGLCNEASVEASTNLLMQNRSLPRPVASRLIHTYGAEVSRVLALAADDPSLLKPLAAPWPFLRVEIAHAALNESALTLQDALCRRTPVFFLVPGAAGEAVYRDAAGIMGRVMGWDADRQQAEITSMMGLARCHMACVQPEAPPA